MRALSKNIGEIFYIYLHTGGDRYEEEGLDHLRHAEQTAYLAAQSGASEVMIVAALLHDIGHLLDPLHNQFHLEGVDRQHENMGAGYLRRLFPDSVCEPVRLHVQAKRYLYTVQDSYADQLDADALASLKVQGGKMEREELRAFTAEEYWEEAVQLRRWDDEASKFFNFQIPPITGYRKAIETVALVSPCDGRGLSKDELVG